MQRSSSVSGETSKSSSSSLFSSFTPTMDTDRHLPTYDPLSHVALRERSRIRSAQKAIHFIPLLILLCAIILWFFSATATTPPTSDYRI